MPTDNNNTSYNSYNLIFSESNSNISSLSDVNSRLTKAAEKQIIEKRKRNNRVFLLVVSLMLVAAIVLLSFIIALAVETSREQKAVNTLENDLSVINLKIKNMEKELDNKYDIEDLENQESEYFNDIVGRTVNLKKDVKDMSIAHMENTSASLSTFLSTIANNFRLFWNFLN